MRRPFASWSLSLSSGLRPRNSFKRVSRAAAPAPAAGRRLKDARARARSGPELRRAVTLVVTRRQSELVKPRRQMGKKSFRGGNVSRRQFCATISHSRPRCETTRDEGKRERERERVSLLEAQRPRGHGERVIKRVAGEKYFPTRFRPALNEIEDPTSRCVALQFSLALFYFSFLFFSFPRFSSFFAPRAPVIKGGVTFRVRSIAHPLPTRDSFFFHDSLK